MIDFFAESNTISILPAVIQRTHISPSSVYSSREPLEMSGIGFHGPDVLAVTNQQCHSTEGNT